MSDNKITDFEAAKTRRIHDGIDASQARWEEFNRWLVEIMATSKLSDTALTSATLNALLEILQAGDNSLQEAKERIARALAAFR